MKSSAAKAITHQDQDDTTPTTTTTTAELELEQQIEALENNLIELKIRRYAISSNHHPQGQQQQHRRWMSSGVYAPEQAGYLYKWQDREIGWGGTKWARRFVTLHVQQGQLVRVCVDYVVRFISVYYMFCSYLCRVFDERHISIHRKMLLRRKRDIF